MIASSVERFLPAWKLNIIPFNLCLFIVTESLLGCGAYSVPSHYLWIIGDLASLRYHRYLSHYHHYTDLFESIEHIKCLLDLCNVCLRLSQFFQLSFVSCMGLCIFSWPISLVMIVRICAHLIITIKLEARIIYHCFVLGHEAMVRTVCLAMYLKHNIHWKCFM